MTEFLQSLARHAAGVLVSWLMAKGWVVETPGLVEALGLVLTVAILTAWSAIQRKISKNK